MVVALLQHRGVLQLALGAGLVWAGFQPSVRIGMASAAVATKSAFLSLLLPDPDLILIAALLVSAALPARLAHRCLALSYAFAAGVITTASFSYVARDAASEGWLTMLTAAVCAIAAALLGFGRPPADQAREPAQ